EWKMETSDNIDLGFRYSQDMVSLSASLFWAKHYDVLVSSYNPTVQLDYFQNAGQLSAYGTDAELYIKPAKQITVFLNPAWTYMSYDKDLKRGGQTIDIKGNQAPATPEFSLKSGITWSSGQLNSSLFIKHTGSRYGDATNTEKLDAYTISNFNADYTFNNFLYFRNMEISLNVNNIFNKKYVGAIDVSDDTNSGSASYFPGAPRTIAAGLTILF
ncbi:MAG TPA: TonB-dependent receptor, partial [Bacteroidales bacterium]|nr:TonB-dependent receptor [Bacteroidales bacterium]